jgi:hypothetical protein
MNNLEGFLFGKVGLTVCVEFADDSLDDGSPGSDVSPAYRHPGDLDTDTITNTRTRTRTLS